jgi:hypothetical protein
MPEIDFEAPSEMFVRATFGKSSPFRYRRFGTAAEAIRFAVEELPEAATRAAVIEVDEVRHDWKAILALYESLTARGAGGRVKAK